MRSPRRESLELAIIQEREKLLATGWTTRSQLWKRVKEQHPDVVTAWKDELADERGMELCHQSLVAKVTRRAQLPLPMFGETRRTYTVKDGRGFRNVPVELGTLGDVDDDLEVSARNKKGSSQAAVGRAAGLDM